MQKIYKNYLDIYEYKDFFDFTKYHLNLWNVILYFNITIVIKLSIFDHKKGKRQLSHLPWKDISMELRGW